MITAVIFDDTIPVNMNVRESRFYAADGWIIREVSPGRITLNRSDVMELVSQGLPYTLWLAPDLVAAEEAVPPTKQHLGRRKP